jgi:hypothetical protein
MSRGLHLQSIEHARRTTNSLERRTLPRGAEPVFVVAQSSLVRREGGFSVNQLRQLMLEELHRRSFAETTIRAYMHGVTHFSRHFRRSPDQFCPVPSDALHQVEIQSEHRNGEPQPADAG